MFRVAVISVPLLFVVACQTDDTGVEISVEGTGFESSNGLTAHVALVRVSTDEIVDVTELAIADGLITASWRDGVLEGVAYRVDAYIDADGNGYCEPGLDETFAFDVESGPEGIDLGFFPGSAGDTRGCLAFGGSSLSLEGRDFSPNKGVYAALVRDGDDVVLDVQHVTTDEGGRFEASWPGGIRPGMFYRVDWFVDANTSATCDVSASEGPWSYAYGALGGDPSGVGLTGGSMSATAYAQSAPDPAACDSFPDGV